MNLTAIAIVAVIAWTIVSIVNSVSNKSGKKLHNKDKQQLESEIAELKERVATLEKIVTEESYSLKKEIDALDDDKAA